MAPSPAPTRWPPVEGQDAQKQSDPERDLVAALPGGDAQSLSSRATGAHRRTMRALKAFRQLLDTYPEGSAGRRRAILIGETYYVRRQQE
jgi:hypothetical protein